jgi:hypothetical protein
MSLTYGLRSARDLFGKLQRDAATLDEEVTSDKFFNFVVTTDSLRKWLENDPSVPASAQRAVLSLYVDKSSKRAVISLTAANTSRSRQRSRTQPHQIPVLA